MGTRSRIGVMHGSNCKSIYVHWDGYPTGVGRVLYDYYNSSKANHLVSLGDASSLCPDVFVPEGVEHSFDTPAKGITTFYGRDRGEKNTEWKTDVTFEAFLERADGCGAEYYYIMQDGEWFVGSTYSSDTVMGSKLVPLAIVLAEQDIETNEANQTAEIA
jgi:hypothetical protein